MNRFPSSVVLAFAAAAWAGNALVNGDFEDGMDGWTSDGAEVSLESVQGELSCGIRQDVPRWSSASQIVAVPEATGSVRVSGWVRADSVRGGKDGWERGRLSIEFHDAKGDTVGGYPTAVAQVRGRKPWTRVERTYPVPVGAKTLRIDCALGNSTGTFHCDDLSVEFVP